MKESRTSLYRVMPPDGDRDAKTVAREIVELYRREYGLTTEAVCRLLCCERQWVEDYIIPNVRHILVTKFFGKFIVDELKEELTRQETTVFGRYLYYISKIDLERFYRETASATQKTSLLDLCRYARQGSVLDLLSEKRVHERAAKSTAERGRHLMRMQEFLSEEGYELYLDSLRRDWEWTPTPLPKLPLQKLDAPFRTTAQIVKRERLHSNTAAYNYLIREGAVRVKFGGKVLWVKPSYLGDWLIPVQYMQAKQSTTQG